MKKFFIAAGLVLSLHGFAQRPVAAQKGSFYFGLGFNTSYYTKSTITLKSSNNAFNFTLDKVRASDDKGWKFGGGSAVQYSYVAGYIFRNRRYGIEFNFDHLKYFVTQNQVVHITGQINGTKMDKDTVLGPDFVQLEHSDGANYAMLNLVKFKPLITSANKKNRLDLVLKAGAGIVIPKTNSTIMGEHYDDAYVLSGYVVGLEGGLRYNFLRYGFLAGSFKGAYANYNRFRIAAGTGKQDWFSAQFNLIAGVQFPL